MGGMTFRFEAELWRWAARRELWTFVSLPLDVSDLVTELVEGATNGWGSVRVDAEIGGTRFRTSIFPAGTGLGEAGSWVLPVKRAVRDAAAAELGDVVTVELELVDF